MFDFLGSDVAIVLIGVVAPFVIWAVNSIFGLEGKMRYFATWVISLVLGLAYAVYSQGLGIFQSAETVAVVFTTANVMYTVLVKHLEKSSDGLA